MLSVDLKQRQWENSMFREVIAQSPVLSRRQDPFQGHLLIIQELFRSSRLRFYLVQNLLSKRRKSLRQ